MPASLFMALSKALCKSVALRAGDEGSVTPDEIITQTNIEAARDNPEMNFVTAVAGVLDLENGLVAWSTAGHDEPIHMIKEERRVEQWASNNGPPLCVIDDIRYNLASASMSPGDTLVMFTDGITEAQDIHGNFYGLDRLMNCLDGLADAVSTRVVLEGMLNDVQSFVGEAEQADDMTILTIRWLGKNDPPMTNG